MAPRNDPSTSWPASKVELREVAKIQPYDRNPRTHPEEQISLIAASMLEDGVTAPILVDEDGMILYGHGRRLAAIRNGFARYPVIVARGLSEAKKKALRIKDNALALMSGWDSTLIRAEMMDLKTAGYELKLLGFGDTQLVSFMTTPGPPAQFAAFGENIPTEFCCPKCKYSWSGNPKPNVVDPEKPEPKKAQKKK